MSLNVTYSRIALSVQHFNRNPTNAVLGMDTLPAPAARALPSKNSSIVTKGFGTKRHCSPGPVNAFQFEDSMDSIV